jgi:hypothetical protein
MGQSATGILYGCEAPEFSNDDDGEAAYDVIRRWEKSQGINWTGGGARVRCESEGDKQLIGIWIAVGGSGEDDAPYFVDGCIRLADFEKHFGKQIKIARALWKRFAKYVAKNEKIDLPAAELWITPCEVA